MTHKPGAERQRFRPDVIETYEVATPTTLLPFLFESMPQRKRVTIKDYLKHNQVAVNNVPLTQFNTELNPGDIVKVNLSREFPVFYHRRMQLVYEDEDIIVVNKGYGLLSMGTDKVKEGTAYSIVRDYVKWQDPRNKIFIVHRLDRDTSGLMMFARTVEAKEAMQHNWNNMVLNRKYLAVVEGDAPGGTITDFIFKDSRLGKAFIVERKRAGVKEASLEYEPVSKKETDRGIFTLVKVKLHTGRFHQIRAQFSSRKMPIVGDGKYGSHDNIAHLPALFAFRFSLDTPARKYEFLKMPDKENYPWSIFNYD